MIYILLFLSIILSCNSLKPNFCYNCKYLIKDSENIEFSKCSIYPIIREDHNYLVTGIIKNNEIEYTYCSIARNSDVMCGKEGKKYKRKYIRKFQ
jgi:hypothetical protein